MLSQRVIDACMAEVLQNKAERERVHNSQYAEFQRKYFNNPIGFFNDCVDWGDDKPAIYQLEAVDRLNRNRRLAAKGPRGLGKSTIAALTIWWYALTRDGQDWKIPTTAGSWSQLKKYLWPEVHKWSKKLKWEVIGRPKPIIEKELLTMAIKLTTGESFAVASNNPGLLEGAHADNILYVFDESKEIRPDTWDSVEGAMSTGKAHFLAISTPGEEQGRFYEILSHKAGYEDWDTMSVSFQQCLDAGRIDKEWAERRKVQWGESSQVYRNHVLGEFAQSDEGAIIPLGWIEAAVERYKEWRDDGFPGEYTGLGIDVGLGCKGSDKITMAIKYDEYKIKEVRARARANPETSTMETVGHAKGIADVLGKHRPIVTDSIGIGAGVGHRLSEMGYNVFQFNAAGKPPKRFKDESGEFGFLNNRAAMWMLARELLNPENGNDVCLPDIPELIGDLTSVSKIIYTSTSKIQLESKDEIRKKIGRSPDYADAVLQILTGYMLVKKPEFKTFVVGYGEVQGA